MQSSSTKSTKQRARWGESEARAALAALDESGETMAAFAGRHGYSVQRLTFWRKRLGRDARIGFQQVTLPLVATQFRAGREDAMIGITVGDVVVRVREGIDVERLAELVRALGRGTC
jgi:transposase-like protein